MKIIQITDPHLVAPGQRLVNGLDPGERLSRTLGHLRVAQADADLLVITGDLTDDGDPRAYAMLREMLEGLPMPVRLLMGNHDARAPFRTEFPDQPVDAAGFVQSLLDLPETGDRLLFLDTLSPGEPGGRYCEARMGWLRQTLAAAPERPVTVFLHHPPVDPGMRHLAQICLHDAEPLLAALQAHPAGLRYLVFGHIHIPLDGQSAAGFGYHAGRGLCHQLRQEHDNPAPDWVDGPLNYDVIRIGAAGIMIQGVDLFEAETIARTQPSA